MADVSITGFKAAISAAADAVAAQSFATAANQLSQAEIIAAGLPVSTSKEGNSVNYRQTLDGAWKGLERAQNRATGTFQINSVWIP